MPRITLHAIVTGRVQGVWFRQSTREQAESHGLTGWVRNLPDGSVEVLLQGESLAVHQVEAWLGQGPALANVAEVEARELDDAESFSRFQVL